MLLKGRDLTCFVYILSPALNGLLGKEQMTENIYGMDDAQKETIITKMST